MLEINKIYCGDCLEIMKSIDNGSIDCCVTSPPYWCLRDYGVEGQLGLEPTLEEYINKLCNIFDEVKRILKKKGTCWVVIGDTYFSGGGKAVNQSMRRQSAINAGIYPNYAPNSKLRSKLGKSLALIPFRFAIEMVNRGWLLRNTIIWEKPNCMPQSVKDRFTVDFEYVFFFVKNKQYYFEQQFEPNLTNINKDITWNGNKNRNWINGKSISDKTTLGSAKNIKGRNKRSVWKISTTPFKGSHFAVYPKELIKTPIIAGCPEGGVVLDPFIGSGTTAVVCLENNRNYIGIELNKDYYNMAIKRLRQETLFFNKYKQ